MKVLIKRLHSEELPLPEYMSEGAAGMDLYAAIDSPVTVVPGGRELISTGISIALPEGYEAQIRPRSGLAIKHGITLLNTPGTVDADYRGEIKLIIINLGTEPYVFHKGDRVAQMVIQKVEKIEWELVEELEETLRSDGGFGHTGV